MGFDMSDSDRWRLKVVLNGTDTNPYARWGLKQNPFPQLGKAEYDRAERAINSLGGEPIKDEADIRQRLRGFKADFVNLCVRNFKKGATVTFYVTFPKKESEKS